MIEAASEVYDNGGAGDGNLTQATEYPGGSAANRVTQDAYDWRDRLVEKSLACKAARTRPPIARSLTSSTTTWAKPSTQESFDGDGVQLSTLGSTAGVPNAPSSSLLRAKATQSYDDQGRVYQSTTSSALILPPARWDQASRPTRFTITAATRWRSIRLASPQANPSTTAWDERSRSTSPTAAR